MINSSLINSTVDYYFLPIDDREIDKTSKSISNFSNYSANFISWLNGNLTSLPQLLNISAAFSIPFNTNPMFSTSFTLNITASDTWVHISGLGLSSNGSIYLEIYEGFLFNDTTPTYQQIINNQKYDSSDGVKSVQIQFVYEENNGLSYHFTNLRPHKSYIIAYFGTNDNPSYQDFLTTEIRKANVTTLLKIKASFAEWIKFSWILWIILEVLLNL